MEMLSDLRRDMREAKTVKAVKLEPKPAPTSTGTEEPEPAADSQHSGDSVRFRSEIGFGHPDREEHYTGQADASDSSSITTRGEGKSVPAVVIGRTTHECQRPRAQLAQRRLQYYPVVMSVM